MLGDLYGLFWGLSIVLVFMYRIFMRRYISAWDELAEWHLPERWRPKTSLSIIIPARNEAENISSCLQSILQQNYLSSLLEIIVIDDHSTDDTAKIVQAFIKKRKKTAPVIKLINLADCIPENTQSYKKAAITAGIKLATGELIVTTDADCTASSEWLAHIASFYEKKDLAFITAPVNFHKGKGLLEKFQALDYAGMMLITGAGIQGKFAWMSNGANLAYPRELFYELNGFEGIDQVASGDDMLFMQKVFERFPDKIGFLKSKKAVVFSHAKKDWRSFFQQRLRWAGKTAAYRQPRLVLRQSVAFLYCAMIFISLLWTFSFGWFALLLFSILFIVKGIYDFLLLRKASHFFGCSELMKIFPLAEWMHTGYIFLVGLLSLLIKQYEWKGRKVK